VVRVEFSRAQRGTQRDLPLFLAGRAFVGKPREPPYLDARCERGIQPRRQLFISTVVELIRAAALRVALVMYFG